MAGFMDSFKAAKSAPPMPGKKPGLEVAIGVGKPGMPPDDGPKDQSSGDDGALNEGEKVAAHALASSIGGGVDPIVLGRALKAFIASCDDGDEDSDDDKDSGAPVPPMPGK